MTFKMAYIVLVFAGSFMVFWTYIYRHNHLRAQIRGMFRMARKDVSLQTSKLGKHMQ